MGHRHPKTKAENVERHKHLLSHFRLIYWAANEAKSLIPIANATNKGAVTITDKMVEKLAEIADDAEDFANICAFFIEKNQ